MVQSMLEFSSPDQQISITSLSLQLQNHHPLTLASDRHGGTYVAPGLSAFLTPNPTALLALVTLLCRLHRHAGPAPVRDFFLQRLVGSAVHSLSRLWGCLPAAEDILASLYSSSSPSQGGRSNGPGDAKGYSAHSGQVARWVEENTKVAIVSKPGFM